MALKIIRLKIIKFCLTTTIFMSSNTYFVLKRFIKRYIFNFKTKGILIGKNFNTFNKRLKALRHRNFHAKQHLINIIQHINSLTPTQVNHKINKSALQAQHSINSKTKTESRSVLKHQQSFHVKHIKSQTV